MSNKELLEMDIIFENFDYIDVKNKAEKKIAIKEKNFMLYSKYDIDD